MSLFTIDMNYIPCRKNYLQKMPDRRFNARPLVFYANIGGKVKSPPWKKSLRAFQGTFQGAFWAQKSAIWSFLGHFVVPQGAFQGTKKCHKNSYLLQIHKYPQSQSVLCPSLAPHTAPCSKLDHCFHFGVGFGQGGEREGVSQVYVQSSAMIHNTSYHQY